MKPLFRIALSSILLYLLLDVVVRGEEKGPRLIVQTVGGLSLILVSWYNLYNINSLFSINKYWPFIKTWRIFIGLLICYYSLAFLDVPSNLANTASVRNIVIAVYGFVVIVFFYYSVINQHLSNVLLNVVLLIVLANGLWEIYYAFSFQRLKQGVEVINTSAGYIFVMILPVLLYRFRKDNIWIFLVTLILTMLTGKRGALVIYAVLILYGLLNYKTISRYFRINWKIVLFLVLIIVSYSVFMEYAYESLQHRLLTIKNEQRGTIASGRDVIWSTLLSAWYNGDFINLLFGFGFYATIPINRFIAHNDFVEFLVDFGLIGLLLYCVVLVQFFKNIKRVKIINKHIFSLLMICFFVLIGRGFIAGTIRTDNIVLSISIGYLLGQAVIKRHKQEKIK